MDTPFLVRCNPVQYNLFVARVSSTGKVEWASAFGSTEHLVGMMLTSNGNIYLSGSFDSPMTIGPYNLPFLGVNDIYVVRFKP